MLDGKYDSSSYVAGSRRLSIVAHLALWLCAPVAAFYVDALLSGRHLYAPEHYTDASFFSWLLFASLAWAIGIYWIHFRVGSTVARAGLFTVLMLVGMALSLAVAALTVVVIFGE